MRHGDTCCLCDDAILNVNEIVRPSVWPWLLLDAVGLAHRDCANGAVAQAEAGKQAAEDGYRDAMGWPETY